MNEEDTNKEVIAETAEAASEASRQDKVISFEHFAALEIKIGTIIAVEIVADADKLLKLTVDLGEAAPRQIVSGIREFFPDEQVLVGKQSPFVANLAPRKIRGLESQGMILAAGEDSFALLSPSESLTPGTRVR